MAFLYDILLNEFGKRAIAQVPVPNHITDNLGRGYGKRTYQIESFQRFILCHEEDFPGKPSTPLHLLYNMATGSGKTLVMAGLILHLHSKGYRNFLFFVNSNNIIQKTRDNFLNPHATKYLFGDKIFIDGKEVLIKDVQNFDEADHQNINIKFTTIQMLHSDLNNTKENSITYEDLSSKKIALIADEAHHLSSATKSNGELFGSWEGTVMEILNRNHENILLEFTATLDYESQEIVNKYQDKVIYKYGLAQFRKDKFSKEINLIRSSYGEKERILQALILNLYRQELAASMNINLKPVILFKAKKTIAESEQNKENFHNLIDELSAEKIDRMKTSSKVDVVQKAFRFFDRSKISAAEIVKRLKLHFDHVNCISANNDAEAEQNQIRLNTLEDENNPVRAVFAVQKLNEGWDVLNLFDIVRLYEGRDGKANKPGKTTISEAQLIGRGARYFPFKLEQGQDKFTRKFDNDPYNELRTLEELYYHTKEDNRYISELKKVLIDSGIYEDEDDLVEKQLTLKPDFKKSDIYRTGMVAFNKRIEKSFANIRSFSDLEVKRKNFECTLSSGQGKVTGAFESAEETDLDISGSKDVKLSDIPKHIVHYALTQNPFFYFESLQKYFPNLECVSEFIQSKNYLGGLEIRFTGSESSLSEISNTDFLKALQELLQVIESEIKSNITEYEGSEFTNDFIREVFRDKKIKVNKKDERAREQTVDQQWYAYKSNFGTSEEKNFVKLFAADLYDKLKKKFKSIYLIRNERDVKIFDKSGRAFEPDFILFCKKKNGNNFTYQVFVEPKGDHLKSYDKWKEDFMREIKKKRKTLNVHTEKYLVTAVPLFYSESQENEFKTEWESTLAD